MATHRCPVWGEKPTPNMAGMMSTMPRALTWIRPLGVERIRRSASQPPAKAPTIAAACQYKVADTPALPWPILNSDFRMAGIQSRTTQPASAGNVKYITSRRNDRLPKSARTVPSPAGARSALPGVRGRSLSSSSRGTASPMPSRPLQPKVPRHPSPGISAA